VKEETLVQLPTSKPAILITGAHHSREMITIQMVLYSLVKLLQQGIVAEIPEIQKLLA
jgi:hypothetical protein